MIGDDGQQIGVVKRDEALAYARERDLDLVEIAPEAKPPVCRVLDYSKYKYEQEQRRKQARKHQHQVTIREMKLRPKIATHDYETKKGHVLRFLKHNDKVKVTIMFRGREQAHPERGEILLRKLADELGEFGIIEQEPNQEGRNMTMVLAPVRQLPTPNSKPPDRPDGERPDGAAPSSTPKAEAEAEAEAAPGSAPAPEAPADETPAPEEAADETRAPEQAAAETPPAPEAPAGETKPGTAPPADSAPEAAAEIPD